MTDPRGSAAKTTGCLAVILVAICLVPVGAHLFELPHKMALSPPDYMTVQGIYAGWALFGIPIAAALVLTLAHAIAVRADRPALAFSVAAFLCLLAGQATFWSFTFPINVASSNWTRLPDDFEAARRQWEYSHAVDAALTFIALLAITLSAIGGWRERQRQPDKA